MSSSVPRHRGNPPLCFGMPAIKRTPRACCRACICILRDLASSRWTMPAAPMPGPSRFNIARLSRMWRCRSPRDDLAQALASAQEEVNSRMAILGDEASPSAASGGGTKNSVAGDQPPSLPACSSPLSRPSCSRATARPTKNRQPADRRSRANTTAAAPSPVKSRAEADEKVDALIEKAQRAMLDRHFIDPVAGSALSLYREVLIIEPDNGEALQGLQRLSEILIARVQVGSRRPQVRRGVAVFGERKKHRCQ